MTYRCGERTFSLFRGSPRCTAKKAEILADILGRKAYDPGKCLFLGDAMTDYEAAMLNGMCFMGIVKDAVVSPFPCGTSTSPVVTLEFPDKHSMRGNGNSR